MKAIHPGREMLLLPKVHPTTLVSEAPALEALTKDLLSPQPHFPKMVMPCSDSAAAASLLSNLCNETRQFLSITEHVIVLLVEFCSVGFDREYLVAQAGFQLTMWWRMISKF